MKPVILNTLPQEFTIPRTFTPPSKPVEGVGNFADTLKQFVNSVNDLQSKAGDSERAFLNGDIKDVHQVMIAVEEASVAFELLMEIRNKLLEAYQSLQRMPI